MSGMLQLLSSFGIDPEQIKGSIKEVTNQIEIKLGSIDQKLAVIQSNQEKIVVALNAMNSETNRRFGVTEQALKLIQAANLDLTDLPPMDAEEPHSR